MSVQEEIKTTVDELLKVLSMKNIVGEPVEFDGKVVITVTKLGIGFGAGSGMGKGEKGDTGSGGGAGGAAGVTPVAVIVIDKGVPGPAGVKVMPLTAAPTGIGKALGEVASIMVDRMGQKGAAEEKRRADQTPPSR